MRVRVVVDNGTRNLVPVCYFQMAEEVVLVSQRPPNVTECPETHHHVLDVTQVDVHGHLVEIPTAVVVRVEQHYIGLNANSRQTVDAALHVGEIFGVEACVVPLEHCLAVLVLALAFQLERIKRRFWITEVEVLHHEQHPYLVETSLFERAERALRIVADGVHPVVRRRAYGIIALSVAILEAVCTVGCHGTVVAFASRYALETALTSVEL